MSGSTATAAKLSSINPTESNLTIKLLLSVDLALSGKLNSVQTLASELREPGTGEPRIGLENRHRRW
jgi:hypothetical protein